MKSEIGFSLAIASQPCHNHSQTRPWLWKSFCDHPVPLLPKLLLYEAETSGRRCSCDLRAPLNTKDCAFIIATVVIINTITKQISPRTRTLGSLGMRRPSPPPEWEGNMEEEEEEEVGEEEEMDFRRQEAEVSPDIVELVDNFLRTTTQKLQCCNDNEIVILFSQNSPQNFASNFFGTPCTCCLNYWWRWQYWCHWWRNVTNEKMSPKAVVIKMTLMTLITGKRSKFWRNSADGSVALWRHSSLPTSGDQLRAVEL